MANMKIRVPDDQEAGVYANILGVWHTAYEFTFDFAVTLPPENDESGNLTVPARVVSRVKLPPSVVFDIIKTINENFTTYEANHGEVRAPGDNRQMTIPDGLLDADEQGDENA